jgi:hypothetical protein
MLVCLSVKKADFLLFSIATRINLQYTATCIFFSQKAFLYFQSILMEPVLNLVLLLLHSI